MPEGPTAEVGLRRTANRHLAALGLALLLLGPAWAVANPVGAASDEVWHYVKALGLRQGDLHGDPFPVDIPALDGRQTQFVAQTTRKFEVPVRLTPRRSEMSCTALRSEPATCLNDVRPADEPIEDHSYVGRYPPLPYAVPAVATFAGHGPASGLWAARIAQGLCCVALVVVAAAAHRDRAGSPVWLLGLLATLSPMAVFLFFTMNPSGLEIAASAAFGLLCLRLARPPAAPGWVMLAAGTAGLVLTQSRPIGAVWVVLGLLLPLGVYGPRKVMTAVRQVGRTTAVALTMVGAGIALSLAWAEANGLHAPPGHMSLSEVAGQTFGSMPRLFRELVGVFGWRDTPMPAVVPLLWGGVLLSLATLAVVVGTLRQRVACLTAPVVLVAVTVGYSVVYHGSGFDVQGRHLLPAVVLVPLLWGEVLAQGAGRLPSRVVAPYAAVLVVVVAGLNALCWYLNARRYAVGLSGPLNFIGSSLWAPPLGWGPWAGLALAGCGALILGGWPRSGHRARRSV